MPIRIDNLPPVVFAAMEHELPAMKDGVTVRLSLAQVYSLISAALVDGAPATLDTLNELAAALGDDPNFAATTATALGNRLRFDAQQTLTNAQKSQALANLGGDALAPDFVQGLILSNNGGDANNRIDISSGRAKGGVLVVVNSSAMTKRLDAVWSAGSGNGGLDTGAKAPGTTYRVWLLRRISTGAFDAIFSVSTTASGVTTPTGYEVIAPRDLDVGMILTDGSGAIIPFTQDGRDFYWNVAQASLPNDLSTTASRSKALLSCRLPTGRRVEGIFSVTVATNSGDSGQTVTIADGVNNNAEKVSAVYVSIGLKRTQSTVEQFTNTSAQISVAVDQPSTPSPTIIKTLGWVDYQIPRLA